MTQQLLALSLHATPVEAAQLASRRALPLAASCRATSLAASRCPLPTQYPPFLTLPPFGASPRKRDGARAEEGEGGAACGVCDIGEEEEEARATEEEEGRRGWEEPLHHDALFDILISERFAMSYDLLAAIFHVSKPDDVICLQIIDAKMRNGDYEQNSRLLDHDIKQVSDENYRHAVRLLKDMKETLLDDNLCRDLEQKHTPAERAIVNGDNHTQPGSSEGGAAKKRRVRPPKKIKR